MKVRVRRWVVAPVDRAQLAPVRARVAFRRVHSVAVPSALAARRVRRVLERVAPVVQVRAVPAWGNAREV